jgi:predicted phage baseplate assembly protein
MTSDGCGCGCCAGLTDRTPTRLGNRPGLGEIAYRAGTYRTFRESMVAGLTRTDRPALAGLRTRDPADFSMALIDAWAVTADVLTFYTERIAHENFLGTATERRSVAGLVGLIGYRLGPGVAAQTALAFTLATSPGSPPTVPIPAGAKVQTLPGPGELPQTFETVEDLAALAGWNAPLARRTEPRLPRNGDTSVLLAGAAAGVSRGDTLLFVAENHTSDTGFALVRVISVRPDATNQRTAATFAPALSGLDDGEPIRVHAMRQRAALFGYNAASPLMFVDEVKTALIEADQIGGDPVDWLFEEVQADEVDLDAVYEGVTVGSPMVFLQGTSTTMASVDTVAEATRTAYGISAKVTRLDVDATDADLTGVGGSSTRTSTVLVRAEELQLSEVPVVTPVHGDTIELETPLESELPRTILVRGRRPRVTTDPKSGATVIFEDGTPDVAADSVDLTAVAIEPDRIQPEIWTVRVETDEGATGTITASSDVEELDGPTLLLSEPLAAVYERSAVVGRSVEIWGNVATATHGESVVNEVLGSGDASVAFQKFPLRGKPLTYVQAGTESGGESTLKVFVNDIQWHEVPTLFGCGPRDRVFVTTTTDDGTTIVQIGDGLSGSRAPSGTDNIRATYRVETGVAGLAKADQLSLLMTRPLGVTGVRNPLAATGAQDPQRAEDAADNAPRTVLTLDRVVSLRDYEDFAANFGGIGKASATWTWDGVVRGVILTVAGIDGAPVDETGPLMDNLTDAIAAAGNPRVPLAVRPAEAGAFTLEAALVLDPDHVADTVVEAARLALLDHFSFARRAFGQIVSLGEVDEVLHAVRGVTGVLVTRLHRTGETALRNPFLLARSLVPGQAPAAEGAEVLTIDSGHLVVEVAP